MRHLLLAAIPLLLPLAAADQSLLVIEDEVGDVGAWSAPSIPPPQPMGIDLTNVSLALGDDALLVTHIVDDFESLDNGQPFLLSSAEFRLEWQQEGYRNGQWMTRTFYDGNWRAMAEGPCIDGEDRDGCPGEDRDIHDGLTVIVDEVTGSVTTVVPTSIFGDELLNWSTFWGESSTVLATYPAFFKDTAQDLSGFSMQWPIGDTPEMQPHSEAPEAKQTTPGLAAITTLAVVALLAYRRQTT